MHLHAADIPFHFNETMRNCVRNNNNVVNDNDDYVELVLFPFGSFFVLHAEKRQGCAFVRCFHEMRKCI